MKTGFIFLLIFQDIFSAHSIVQKYCIESYNFTPCCIWVQKYHRSRHTKMHFLISKITFNLYIISCFLIYLFFEIYIRKTKNFMQLFHFSIAYFLSRLKCRNATLIALKEFKITKNCKLTFTRCFKKLKKFICKVTSKVYLSQPFR